MSRQHVERLSSLDLLMPGGYVGAALLFRAAGQTSSHLSSFQDAIDKVCERIPWLKGRVFAIPASNDVKPGLEIHWSGEDATPGVLDKGKLEQAYESLREQGVPHESIPVDVWPLANTVQAGAESKDGAPVFAASVFGFADDAASGLCVQIHHNAVDGFGFAEILRQIARYMSGHDGSPPNLSSAFNRTERLEKALRAESEQEKPMLSLDELFERHPEYSRVAPQMPTKFSACNSTILSIPMSTIDSWKQKLNPFMVTNPSTNTVACTLLWSAITRTRMRRDPELATKTTHLPMAVNGRKRLHADLADMKDPYLGNVVLFSIAEMNARGVAACGTGESVELFAKACQAVADAQSSEKINADHIREVCQISKQTDDHPGIFPGWELFGSRDLFITSWADLNIYDLDFGPALGKPDDVRIPYAQADGNVIILPRKRGSADERIEAVVMLREVDLNVLKDDGLWHDR